MLTTKDKWFNINGVGEKFLSVREKIQLVLEEIQRAKDRRQIAKDEKIILVAVTKNHGVDLMREAIDAGILNIGENRIQEASEKFSILEREGVTKHLIGHLQTNKAKQAVKLFDLIHSVDSENLAAAIEKAAAAIEKVQDVLIQVNLAKEDTKFGVAEENLRSLIDGVEKFKHLRLRGLMMIAPNYDDVEQCRPLFKGMRKIFDELAKTRRNFDYLSMGMTHDYKIAVEEGANIVRVGTAIFGERIY
ncbi:MAG: YggS family pyridoxal phosphate-dependent enzyme [Selenomonadaceae bacterium]|nr:YggS family pyridoxal phosphate-dependent enzyme [Selenomonadaceae bacterium]